ncbi:unnamed protein product [Effrenium voratum]|nr:unnamed protein product [Effrenium voratum]
MVRAVQRPALFTAVALCALAACGRLAMCFILPSPAEWAPRKVCSSVALAASMPDSGGNKATVEEYEMPPTSFASEGAKISVISSEMLEPPAVSTPRTPVEELCLGTTLTGYISDVDHAGAFVDIGAEVEGLVHKSVMSDDFLEDPRRSFKVGQEVQATVVNIVFQTRRPERSVGTLPLRSTEASSLLYLSLAPSKMRLRPSRPEGFDLEVGQRHSGIVSYVQDKGAHVILGDARGGVGHEGWLHVSKMPGYVPSAREVLKVGERIDVAVLQADRDSLLLTCKHLSGDELARGDWLEGNVYNIKPFGVFVEVSLTHGPCQGMVHISEIREGRIRDIFSEVSIGQTVKVRVLSTSDGKVRFSMLPDHLKSVAAFHGCWACRNS